jgi:hypothetical protein
VRNFYPKKFKFFCGDENTECRTRNFNDEVLCVKGEQIAQTAVRNKGIRCRFS